MSSLEHNTEREGPEIHKTGPILKETLHRHVYKESFDSHVVCCSCSGRNPWIWIASEFLHGAAAIAECGHVRAGPAAARA
jgi:hypothetical protein